MAVNTDPASFFANLNKPTTTVANAGGDVASSFFSSLPKPTQPVTQKKTTVVEPAKKNIVSDITTFIKQSPYQVISGLDKNKIVQSFKGGAKSLPGMVEQATGIIASGLIKQKEMSNSFFAPIKKAIGITTPTYQIDKTVQNKAKELASSLREQGVASEKKASDQFSKEFKQSEGFQKYIEMAAYNIPQVLASTGLSLATSLITKNPALGTAVGLTTSYGMGAQQVYSDARQQGVSDKKALPLSMAGGVIIGALDFIPLERLLDKTGAAQTVKKSIIKNIASGIVSLGTQAGWEGITEGAQQIVQNAIALTYDEHRNIMEGVPESAIVGALLGGVSDVTLNTVVDISGKNKGKIEEKIQTAIETPKEERTKEQQDIVEAVMTKEMTPDEATTFVIENKLGTTEQGKKIMLAVSEAQRSGKIIRISPSTDEKSLEITVTDPTPLPSSQEQGIEPTVASKEEEKPIVEESRGVGGGGTTVPEILKDKVGTPLWTEAEKINKKASEEAQPELNQIMKEINDITGTTSFGNVKSVKSLVSKVIRKTVGGREYTLLNEKDHARGTIQIKEWSQALDVLKELKARGFNIEETISNKLNQFGYMGINSNIKLSSGLNGEIQIHTPESWKIKETISDPIYAKWRDYTNIEEQLSPEQRIELKKDIETSVKVWQDYWDSVPRDVKEEISSLLMGKPIVKSPTLPLKGTQEPSLSSKGVSPEESGRISTTAPVGNRKKSVISKGSISSEQPIVNITSKRRVLSTKETQAIQAQIKDGLDRIRQVSDNPETMLQEIDSLYKEIVEKAKDDKVVLSALRTALNKEMYTLSGFTGDYKSDYKNLQEMMKDPEVGPILSKLEDYVKELDTKLITAKEPKVIVAGQGKESTKETPTGTGKAKNSRLYERIKDTLSAEYESQEIKYNELSLNSQAEKVVNLIETDPEKAVRIAKGFEEAPTGMTQSAVSVALAETARAQGDWKTAAELWIKTSLRLTRAGQEIVSVRGSFSINEPLNAVKKLLDSRMELVSRRYKDIIKGLSLKEGATTMEKVDALVKHEAKKAKKQLAETQNRIAKAQEIINALKCK